MHQARVVAIGLEAGGAAPVLLLQELHRRDRFLPIWIGLPEASALALAQRGTPSPRPTTHRLIALLVEAFGRRIEEVRVTALRDHVFLAELVLDGGVVVSARPSDAIAIALHAGVPVLVDDGVLDAAALPADRVAGPADALGADPGEDVPGEEGPGEGGDPDVDLARFRRFLDAVDPEDFAG